MLADHVADGADLRRVGERDDEQLRVFRPGGAQHVEPRGVAVPRLEAHLAHALHQFRAHVEHGGGHAVGLQEASDDVAHAAEAREERPQRRAEPHQAHQQGDAHQQQQGEGREDLRQAGARDEPEDGARQEASPDDHRAARGEHGERLLPRRESVEEGASVMRRVRAPPRTPPIPPPAAASARAWESPRCPGTTAPRNRPVRRAA